MATSRSSSCWPGCRWGRDRSRSRPVPAACLLRDETEARRRVALLRGCFGPMYDIGGMTGTDGQKVGRTLTTRVKKRGKSRFSPRWRGVESEGSPCPGAWHRPSSPRRSAVAITRRYSRSGAATGCRLSCGRGAGRAHRRGAAYRVGVGGPSRRWLPCPGPPVWCWPGRPPCSSIGFKKSVNNSVMPTKPRPAQKSG